MALAITFYSKPDCSYCDAEREGLWARGAAFSEVDVVRHPEVVPELLKLTAGRRIVPVVVEGAHIRVAASGGSEF